MTTLKGMVFINKEEKEEYYKKLEILYNMSDKELEGLWNQLWDERVRLLKQRKVLDEKIESFNEIKDLKKVNESMIEIDKQIDSIIDASNYKEIAKLEEDKERKKDNNKK